MWGYEQWRALLIILLYPVCVTKFAVIILFTEHSTAQNDECVTEATPSRQFSAPRWLRPCKIDMRISVSCNKVNRISSSHYSILAVATYVDAFQFIKADNKNSSQGRHSEVCSDHVAVPKRRLVCLLPISNSRDVIQFLQENIFGQTSVYIYMLETRHNFACHSTLYTITVQ